MLKINGSNGSPSPVETPILPGNGVHYHGLPPPEKRPRLMPPTTERIMIYVKQESEEAFTALHLKPPTIQGLITALESKYKINGRSIRHLHRVNKFSHKVKIDDEMITHYSNEAAFYMQVVMTEQEVGVGEDTAIYDITLTDIDNSSLGNTLQ